MWRLHLCFVFAAMALTGATFALTMRGLWALALREEGRIVRSPEAPPRVRVVFVLVPAAASAASR